MRIVTMSQTPQSIQNAIHEAAAALKRGGLVVFPTDTVYGLLADAKNPKAIDSLLRCKNRAPGRAISVFIESLEQMSSCVDVDEPTLSRLKQILPGPYTIVLASKHALDLRLEAEDRTLGVRLPAYEPVTQLVKAVGGPVTATSANPPGRPSHYSIDTLQRSFSKAALAEIDLIIDAGLLPYRKPSTVVDYSHQQQRVIRQGEYEGVQEKHTYQTSNQQESEHIAQDLAKRYLTQEARKSLVFLLRGELGVGKTVVARQLAAELGITGVVSPTYVVYYEYNIADRPGAHFVHVDLYNVLDESEFAQLGLESYLKPGNVMCIEWSENVGSLLEQIRRTSRVICVDMEHLGEDRRALTVYELPPIQAA